MNIELPIFEEINLKKTNWDYKYEARKWKHDFIGNSIDLDVHFKKIDEQIVDQVSSTLTRLIEIYKIGEKAIQADFIEGEVVKKYIEDWNNDIFLQIFNETEFRDFIANSDQDKNVEERLLSLLRIVRIGIYSESEKSYVTMDFAFGYESDKGFRDNMLVVTLNPNLEVTDICTEG